MLPGRRDELVICEHGECRDYVFFEVLVLIITPYEDEVRGEGIQLSTYPPEVLYQRCAVLIRGRFTLVVAPFDAHLLWPVRWIAVPFGQQRVFHERLDASRQR